MRFAAVLIIILLLPIAVVAHGGVPEEIVGIELPVGVSLLFGDERINTYVSDNGEELIHGIVTVDGVITSVQDGELNDPSLLVYSDMDTIEDVQAAENQISAFMEALNEDRITYETVSFWNNFAFGIAGMFGGIGSFFQNFFQESCEDVTLHVDGNEFSSLEEAFTSIDGQECSSATLMISEGTYNENSVFELQQDTTITGEGRVELSDISFVNNGRYRLEIRDLIITNGGNIRVNNRGAETVLERISITNGLGYGIHQTGGFIEMQDVTITDTEFGSRETMFVYGVGNLPLITRDNGAGIVLDDRVEAILRDVSLSENNGGALRMADRRTKVYANNLLVQNNGANEEQINHDITNYQGTGAVEVRNRALFLAENSNINRNKYIGVLVLDGGRAHIQNSMVSGTTALDNPIENNGASYGGGTNIFVKQNVDVIGETGDAELELSGVRLSEAELTGMVISDGLAKAIDTNLTDNSVGLHLISPQGLGELELDCISDGVFVYDNDIDISRDELQVPNVAGVFDEQEQRQGIICAEVSFRCSWCE